MTTVVCNRYGMASDSLACDGVTTASVTKIKRIHNCLVGIAGVLAEANKFFTYLEHMGDEDVPEPDMEHVTALVLRPNGDIMIYDHCLDPYYIDSPWTAIGSGSAAALAAMHCGKDLKDAVKIAAMVDVYTGGKVVYHTLSTEKKIKRNPKKVVDTVST